MRPPTVDSIMQSPVYTVDVAEPVDAAIKTMDSHSTKKILVTEGGKPKGVLEKWMVSTSDLSRKTGDMELRSFGRARLGASLDDIQGEIRSHTAVYVFSPDKPDEPVGVVTAVDLTRAL